VVVIVVVIVIGDARQSGHEKPDAYGFRPGTWPGPMKTTNCESILSLLRRLRSRPRLRQREGL